MTSSEKVLTMKLIALVILLSGCTCGETKPAEPAKVPDAVPARQRR